MNESTHFLRKYIFILFTLYSSPFIVVYNLTNDFKTWSNFSIQKKKVYLEVVRKSERLLEEK